MAEYTLGEAYSNQGVYRNPQSSFGAFAQGLQTGELLKQRKDARQQKEDELIAKSTLIDPEKYIPALYGAAKEETQKFIKAATELKGKYGSRFIATPEFNQMKADYTYKLKNWEAESAKFNELDRAAREGKAVVDQNYIRAGKSSNFQDWINYKNDLTGEGVDPTSGRSNVNGVPTYDLQKNIGQYFNENDPSLYSINGGTRRLGGGSNDFVQIKNINPQVVRERAALFAKDHPELAAAYLRTRPEEVRAIAAQMVQEAAAKGQQLDPQTAIRGASIRLLEQDIMPRLQKFREEKVNVPEYKPSGGGGGSTQKQWLYTPTTTKDINASGEKSADLASRRAIPKDAPYISVQWTGTEMDNRDLTLPTATKDGEIPVKYQPLAFTKSGNDWIFIGGKTQKFGDVTKNTQEQINMSENKEAAARIANYFGYSSVKEYTDFLDKQAQVKPTQSAPTPQAGYSSVTTLKDKKGNTIKAGVKNGKWYNIETNQPL